MTRLALVEIDAGIGRHLLRRAGSALRTSNDGLKTGLHLIARDLTVPIDPKLTFEPVPSDALLAAESPYEVMAFSNNSMVWVVVPGEPLQQDNISVTQVAVLQDAVCSPSELFAENIFRGAHTILFNNCPSLIKSSA